MIAIVEWVAYRRRMRRLALERARQRGEDRAEHDWLQRHGNRYWERHR